MADLPGIVVSLLITTAIISIPALLTIVQL